MNANFTRRLKRWRRAPLYALQKFSRRVFGARDFWSQKQRDDFPKGSWQWLALTELKYGGVKHGVSSGINIGGDRMSPAFHGYGKVYEKYLAKFLRKPGKPFTLVEIGILNGSGLAIWCDLFPEGRIIGLDINLDNYRANRAFLEGEGAFRGNEPELFEFNQLDRKLASEVMGKVLSGRKADVVIDDGCHSLESIEITFDAAAPHLASECVYFIEDNFDAYDLLAPKHPSFKWSQYDEMVVARR